MKLTVIHIIAAVPKRSVLRLWVPVVMLTLICSAQLMGEDFMYWADNFAPITLQNIQNRDQVSEDSSFTTLFTSGDAEISADNSATAQLSNGADTLVTEYKLTYDGDGATATGGSTVDWTAYDSFLTPTTSSVTYVTDDDEVVVTLFARASNYPNQLANAGEYTATQTMTVHWVGP